VEAGAEEELEVVESAEPCFGGEFEESEIAASRAEPVRGKHTLSAARSDEYFKPSSKIEAPL